MVKFYSKGLVIAASIALMVTSNSNLTAVAKTRYDVMGSTTQKQIRGVIEHRLRITNPSARNITFIATTDGVNEKLVLYQFYSERTKNHVIGIANIRNEDGRLICKYDARRSVKKGIGAVVISPFERDPDLPIEPYTVYAGVLFRNREIQHVELLFKNRKYDFRPTNGNICVILQGVKRSDLESVRLFTSNGRLVQELKDSEESTL